MQDEIEKILPIKPIKEPEKIEELNLVYNSEHSKEFNLYLSPIIDKINQIIRTLNKERKND